jgi:hypothetical protein
MLKPKARTDGLATTTVGDEVVVYDSDRRTAHCLNATAASVFGLCDGRRSQESIAAELSGADLHAVEDAIAQLRTAHLLEDPGAAHRPALPARVSRRQALKRVGAVGAAAALAPVVTSIALPSPAAAQGSDPCNRPPGGSCVNPEDCCENFGEDCVNDTCCRKQNAPCFGSDGCCPGLVCDPGADFSCQPP